MISLTFLKNSAAKNNAVKNNTFTVKNNTFTLSITLLASALLLQGCQMITTSDNSSTLPTAQQNDSDAIITDTSTVTLWVDGNKQPCSAGAGKMQCLQVHRGDTLDADSKWQNFYAPIAGFEFVPNVQKKILVRQTHLDPADVPADASSIRYQLVKVIATQPIAEYPHTATPPQTRLHDIWVVTHINGSALDTTNPRQRLPQLEINTTIQQVMGNDSCNQFTGNVTSLTDSHLAFGALASTRKMCLQMSTADAFNRTINQVASYRFDGLQLILADQSGKAIMHLHKVD